MAPPSPRQALEEERRVIVRAIRDLDFDYRTGKLNEADYRALRAAQVRTRRRGVAPAGCLFAGTRNPGEGFLSGLGAGDPVDAEIEASVTAAKRARTGAGQVRATAACPACGNAHLARRSFLRSVRPSFTKLIPVRRDTDKMYMPYKTMMSRRGAPRLRRLLALRSSLAPWLRWGGVAQAQGGSSRRIARLAGSFAGRRARRRAAAHVHADDNARSCGRAFRRLRTSRRPAVGNRF